MADQTFYELRHFTGWARPLHATRAHCFLDGYTRCGVRTFKPYQGMKPDSYFGTCLRCHAALARLDREDPDLCERQVKAGKWLYRPAKRKAVRRG